MKKKQLVYRNIHLVGATGKTRTALFEGREHLVVPVVALVEGVVWPSTGSGPEFVPGEVLAMLSDQWNGRPCFAGHPQTDEGMTLANHPTVLEGKIGTIFNTVPSEQILRTRRLEVEAWLNISKAISLGGDAKDVVERLQAGETVEVSIGGLSLVEMERGEFNGEQYECKWLILTSDHLAFLKPNQLGACSIDKGCGAQRHLISAKGITKMADDTKPAVPATDKPKMKPSVIAAAMRTLASAFGVHLETDGPAEEAAETISYQTIKSQIDQAALSIKQMAVHADGLLADEAEGTDTAQQEQDEEVVEEARLSAIMSLASAAMSALYSVMDLCWQELQEEAEDDAVSRYMQDGKTPNPAYLAGSRHSKKDMKMLQSAHDQLVTLGAACAPVEKPVAAAAGKSPCSCGSSPAQPATTLGDSSMNKEQKIAAIVANSKTFTAEDTAFLTGMNDAQLDALNVKFPAAKSDEAAKPAALAAKPDATVPAQAAKPVARTEAEILAEMPESMRHTLQKAIKAESDRKAALVKTLTAAQTVYSAERLAAMTIDQLEEVSDLLKSIEPTADFGFSSRTAPSAQASGLAAYEPPDAWAAPAKTAPAKA